MPAQNNPFNGDFHQPMTSPETSNVLHQLLSAVGRIEERVANLQREMDQSAPLLERLTVIEQKFIALTSAAERQSALNRWLIALVCGLTLGILGIFVSLATHYH